MRFSCMVVGGLIATGLLGVPAMAVMPKPVAANLLQRCDLVAAVRSERITLQQIAQVPRGRVQRRTVYSSKPELR